MLKNLRFLLLLIAFVAFCAFCAMGLELMDYARQPADPAGGQRLITVDAGLGLRGIATALAQAGVIRAPFKFRLLARLNGQDKRLQAGEYRLSPALTPLAVLDTLVQGRVRLHRITVPEGYNLTQIAALLASAGLADAAAFRDAARDSQLLRQSGIAADSFEGYLFPDTYLFPGNATAGYIIMQMKGRFDEVYGPAWRERTRQMGWTVHQVVTLASIIEKETAAAAERPLISAVFHNRLQRRMRLETDPSVIYGIPDFDGNLTRRHLATETPYNTYLIPGLPPGPIASPGAAAIEAALFPTASDFLFFVSRNDGTHQFSATYGAHLRAVRKYQLGQ